MTIVVGGQSRNLGKTSVVAGLISAFPKRDWTAVKITQYGHGICSADGSPCDCATDDHSWAITEERDPAGRADSCRYLAAGARHSLWVRTRQGMLAEAMPALRQRLESAPNVILESNSVLKFLRPDLYLTVLDYTTQDFKLSAREYLDRADAIILSQSAPAPDPALKTDAVSSNGDDVSPKWTDLSLKLLAGKPHFFVHPPQYVSPELLAFVRARLS